MLSKLTIIIAINHFVIIIKISIIILISLNGNFPVSQGLSSYTFEVKMSNLIVKERFFLVTFSCRVLMFLHTAVVVADGEEEGEVVAHHHQHRQHAQQRLEPHSWWRQNDGEDNPPETIY